MARTKMTAKKSNGGSAPRVHLKTLKTLKTTKTTKTRTSRISGGELEGGEPMEVSETVHHNGFCILCRDGSVSFQENPLFMCNHCPRVMCRLCMELPLDTEDAILGEDISFMCICCHMKVAEEGAPYFGFYYPDGTTVLKLFLHVQASLELSVLAEISAAPILFIHLVLIDFETTGSPFPFAHSFLQPYFTSGGIEYRKIVYNIISAPDAYLKTVAQIIKTLNKAFVWEHVVIGISTHTDNDQGDIFAGYSDDGGDKHYVSAGSDQSVLDCAKETYLWLLCCGSLVNNTDVFAGLQRAVVRHKLSATIAFNARHFQPSFTSHLLLAFTEQVLVERCPIRLAFGEMLGQSSKLGVRTMAPRVQDGQSRLGFSSCAAPRTRYQGSKSGHRGEWSGGPGLGIVSTWVEGRQSRRSNDIGSKTGGLEAREPVDPGVGTNRRAREPTGPWRKGQEVDKGTSPKSSE
ncbi:hypothetical protein DFH29DRAFT_884141 [Suillus ampliporus]|nr:hypothetical protein DFH29DRAFT_884141 [Suillus ampliporus]